jgi:hydrogenase maturation protease
MERVIRVPPLALRELALQPAEQDCELNDAEGRYRLRVRVELSAEAVGPDAMRLAITVSNRSTLRHGPTATRAQAALQALASTHLVLEVRDGQFASALDPSSALLGAVHDCRNEGVWPVLVGNPATRDTLLLSPIILSDYPAIAPESPGDFFDATEIDAMLALRLQTLSEAEKRELRRSDPRAQALLDRAERLSPAQMRALHGAWREDRPDAARWVPGDRVRLHPRAGRDVLDLALRGEAATVVGVERDLEGRLYCAVTIDRDPGRDLGAQGCVGHRFFFDDTELERLP